MRQLSKNGGAEDSWGTCIDACPCPSPLRGSGGIPPKKSLNLDSLRGQSVMYSNIII